MKKSLHIFLITLIFTGTAIAQDNGYTGGFQFKAMVASNYFNGGSSIQKLDSVTIETSQNFGYVFGMTFRKQFNKTLAVESGLRFVQRNYTTQVDSTFGNYQGNIDYRIIGYEIPLKGMVRLRASKNSYFSVSLGVELDLYPSDVYGYDYEWQVEVIRKSWIQGSFLANVGWEINPDELGTFYGGFSFNRPFGDPFVTRIGHYNSISSEEIPVGQNGVYLSLDFRYYFQVKKDKGLKK